MFYNIFETCGWIESIKVEVAKTGLEKLNISKVKRHFNSFKDFTKIQALDFCNKFEICGLIKCIKVEITDRSSDQLNFSKVNIF